MSSEEKNKRKVSKNPSQSSNPAKNVVAPKLPVKSECSLDKELNGKRK